MTESERIIKKGVITEDFLKEETICDFLVTSDRKKLFAVLLDMLLEFDTEHKATLQYYQFPHISDYPPSKRENNLTGRVRNQGFAHQRNNRILLRQVCVQDYRQFL